MALIWKFEFLNLGFRFKLKSKLLFPIHFLAVKLDMDTDAEIKKFIILIHNYNMDLKFWNCETASVEEKNILNLFKTFSISLLLAS